MLRSALDPVDRSPQGLSTTDFLLLEDGLKFLDERSIYVQFSKLI